VTDNERYAVQLAETKAEQWTYRGIIAGATIVIVSIVGAISYNNTLNLEKKVEFYQTANSEDIENYLVKGYLP
jgi:hypothetical protein